MTTRRTRALLGAGTTLTLVTAGLIAAATTATGAPTPGVSADCPLPFPTDSNGALPDGLEVTGKTTAGTYYRGTTRFSSPTAPEGFTGVYLDTLEDPTGDVHLFQLQGSRITNPDGSVDAGIWAGISGSPVYANGQLVGSVSYGFTQATGSTIAGITPAAQLYALLDETDPAPAQRIVPSRAERAGLAAAGVPAAATRGALHRLTGPTLLSGVNGLPGRSEAMLAELATKAGMPVPKQGGSAGSQADEVPIVAGGNVAVADSYGSLALYSVGTAAAVCDDVVIGYGHANSWSPAQGTIHGASTATILADGPASMKLVNLAAPVGSLLHDRLAGITGRIGALPVSPAVTVTTTGPRNSSTESLVPNTEALSYVVATQAYRDAALSLDEMGPSEAAVAWDITFKRANGSTQTFTRSQRYASAAAVAEEVPMGVASDIETILDNGFEDVTITDVKVRQTVSRSYRALRLDRIEAWVGGRWTKVRNGGKITVRAGSTIKVRAQLVKDGRRSTGAPISKTFSLTTSKNARGLALLGVSGNGSSFWDFEEFEGEEGYEMPPNAGPTSLNGVLKELAAQPQQNSVSVNFTGVTKFGKTFTRSSTWTTPSVVTGESMLRVKFQAPPKKKVKKSKR